MRADHVKTVKTNALTFSIKVALAFPGGPLGQAFRSGAADRGWGKLGENMMGCEAKMQYLGQLVGIAVVFWGAAAGADGLTVNGHEIAVTNDGMGAAALKVDGQVLHENGVIYLDEATQMVGGVSVVTGVAGAGGNACGAAPFVIALPEGGSPEFYGPADSCAYLPIVDVQPEAIIFASEPTPSVPGEVWVWNRISGLTTALPEEFAAQDDKGWEDLDGLQGAHPVEAMKLAPVLYALQAGLGAGYPEFAERISDLGSGDLTAEGYLGQACLKFTCDTDWAMLYLHPATQGVFAAWTVAGDGEPRLWPEDTSLWPPEALAAFLSNTGG
jgi:hypothetical protein